MLTRFSVAFDDAWDVESPTWTRLDTVYKVESIDTDRGRIFEMDAHDVGRVTVVLRDHNGDFDQTYESGAFYGKCVPDVQAKIEIRNPVTDEVSPLFRGFVESWSYEPHPTERWSVVTVEITDGTPIVAAAELRPDGSFGDDVVGGNIVYTANSSLAAVQQRIVKVLDDLGWPGSTNSDTLRAINTGNVGLWKKPYAPRTSSLTVIKEACEADLPVGSAGFYFARDGEATFMGRYTRIDPFNPDYNIQVWELGDDAWAEAEAPDVAPIVPPLSIYIDNTHVYDVATCTWQGIADADIAAQVYGTGKRAWSAEGLLTRNGEGPTTAAEETMLIAEFIVENYGVPRLRVGSLTIGPKMPDSPYAAAVWALICGVELNDIVALTNTMAWGGGFVSRQFFVEKISYRIVPFNSQIDHVTLTLEVSPAEYAAHNPFASP